MEPFSLTKDNFPEHWNYVDQKRRAARKKARIFKTAGFFSGLVFMLLFTYGMTGLILTYQSNNYTQFLAREPHFSPSWAAVSAALLDPGASWIRNALPLLLVAYGTALAVFLTVAVLLLVLYHPLKKQIPQDASEQAKSKLLVTYATKAYWSARQVKPQASVGCIAIFYLLLACIFVYFAFATGNATRIQNMLVFSWSEDVGLNLNLIIMGVCAVFSFFDYLRSLMIYPLVRYKVPYSFVAETERYFALSVDTENLTDAASIREKALELERLAAYAKAKELLLKAAFLGDVSAMEHYARHCLIAKNKPAAQYWLDQCIATGEASPEAIKMRKRMKWHQKHAQHYLTA